MNQNKSFLLQIVSVFVTTIERLTLTHRDFIVCSLPIQTISYSCQEQLFHDSDRAGFSGELRRGKLLEHITAPPTTAHYSTPWCSWFHHLIPLHPTPHPPSSRLTWKMARTPFPEGVSPRHHTLPKWGFFFLFKIMWRIEVNVGCLPQSFSIKFLETVSHRIRNSLTQLGSLARKPERSPVTTSAGRGP